MTGNGYSEQKHDIHLYPEIEGVTVIINNPYTIIKKVFRQSIPEDITSVRNRIINLSYSFETEMKVLGHKKHKPDEND